nr:probable WRKY transcription factor 32 isoform X1 [Coffea arabica]
MDAKNFNSDNNSSNKSPSCEEEDEAAAQNSKSREEFDENSRGGGGDGYEQVNSKTVDNSSIPVVVAQMSNNRASSTPETLATAASSDLHCKFEVAVDNEMQRLEPAEELKDQVGMSYQEEFRIIADQAVPDQTQNQQEPPNGPRSSEPSPTSVTQPISSVPSPTLPEQKMSPGDNRNTSHTSEADKKNSFDPKTLSVVSIQKTPSPDGYNWRKYGQKQVKSPQGSRSYYRCTYSECCAKKIECSDDSNRVMEIVYRSHHNHDPPQKVNCTRGSRHSLSIAPANGSDSSVAPIGATADSAPSTSSKDSVQEKVSVPDPIQKDSSDSDDNAETNIKQEREDEPEPSKRLKKTVASCSAPLLKPGKKPKIVVHAASDVGISADGYRWRKYGQKMVKGNPHPRNYYRCTSAGCPVRKHIERAKDNTNAVIITYKGVHDHDMPVPKKRHGPPSAPLVAAAAPASMSTVQVVKSETIQNQVSATQWSVDKEGGLKGQTLECGGEKNVESARTLLSIGFEIKPC